MGRILRLVILLFLFQLVVYSQVEKLYNPIADSLFKSGLELFKLGLNAYILYGDTASYGYFSSAYLKFDSVISFGLNHRTSASYLMASKSLCYLNRFEDAEKLLNKFLLDFPQTTYLEDAFYTLGLINIKLGNFAKAVLNLDKAIRRSTSEKVKYIKIVSNIVDSLDIRELEEILKMDLTPNVKYLIVFEVSDRLVSLGKIEDAKKYIADRLVHFQGTEYYEKLMFRISYLDRLIVRPKVKIGVLLPEGESISRSILNGIELGISEHNLNSNPKVGVEVKYYKSGDIDRKLLEFKGHPDVVGIIGPVYSEDVELCARFVKSVGVPIISPTATSDGLTKLSDYIFQFNSDYSTRSRALAQFAIFALGLRYFLVLAPNDVRIKPFVEAFIDEVKQNSAKIVNIQFYNPGEADLRSYFRNLIASLDSMKISVEVSSDSVGLFAPILNPDFIGVISSQVYYHDFKVRILGNDVWNNFTELYMNRQYTSGVVFTSGQYVDLNDFAFKTFKDRFGFEPDEFSVYGYDAVKMLLKIIEEGRLTAGEVYSTLLNYEGMGVGRDVIFDENRVNKSVSILVFKDNLIKRISKWVINR